MSSKRTKTWPVSTQPNTPGGESKTRFIVLKLRASIPELVPLSAAGQCDNNLIFPYYLSKVSLGELQIPDS